MDSGKLEKQEMSLRKVFFVLCLITSVFCLTAGFGIAGWWALAVLSGLLGPGWLLAQKYPGAKLQSVCLLASVGFAVVGILIGSPAIWMVLGATMALAVWDLLLLDAAVGKRSSVEQTRHYENSHLRSLALALSVGLVVSLFGHLISIQIPYVVMLLSSAVLLFALDRVWFHIKKIGKP